jgi:hypothetical protein
MRLSPVSININNNNNNNNKNNYYYYYDHHHVRFEDCVREGLVINVYEVYKLRSKHTLPASLDGISVVEACVKIP